MVNLEEGKAEVHALLKRLNEHRTQLINATEDIERLITHSRVSENGQKLLTAFREACAPAPATLSTAAAARLEALKKRLFMAQAREADIREQLGLIFSNCEETSAELQQIIGETRALRREIDK